MLMRVPVLFSEFLRTPMGLAWAMGAGGAMARCPLGPYAVLAMGPRYASRMHRLKAHPHASQPPQAQGRSMHTRREREGHRNVN